MLLLDQDTIKKKQVNQNNTILQPAKNFEVGDNQEYKVKVISIHLVYGKKIEI